MNTSRIILIAVLASVLGIDLLGQPPAGAVLIDEFGDVSCEDLKARTDSFLTDLNHKPADLGVVMLSDSTRLPAELTKRIIQANLFSRQFDRDRIQFRFRPKAVSSSTQFWRVPAGAQTPASEVFKDPNRDLSKPFLFGQSERHDLAGICPTFSPEVFADLITNQPDSRARLVIFGPTAALRRKAADSELEIFLRYTELSKRQIEFYFVPRPDWDYTMTEYWYIPAKKK